MNIKSSPDFHDVLSLQNMPWEKNNYQLIQAVSNLLPVAIYTCDKNGIITSYNDAAEKLWGRRPVIGKELWCGSFKIFDSNDEPMELDECPMAKVLKEGGKIEGKEIIVQQPDGNKINVIVNPVALFDNEGVLTGAVNTLINITDQRKEEKLHSMLAALVDSAEDAIVSKDTNGIVTSWNDAAEQMFGYTKKEMIGRSITTLIPHDRLAEEELILRKIRNGEKVEHYETIRKTKNGRYIPVSLTISPIKGANGKVVGASKIARDISRQKLTEEKLQRYTEKLEIVNKIDKTISLSLDVEDILQKVINATTRLTGANFGAFFYNKVDENGEVHMLYTLAGVSKETFETPGMPGNTAIFNSDLIGEGIVLSDDITKDERYGKNSPSKGMPPNHLPIVSYLAIPVKTQSGSVIGGLFYGHKEKGKFTDDHANIISAIAIQTAAALTNAKLYEKASLLNSKKDEFISLASHELKTPLTSMLGYLQITDAQLDDDDENKLFIQKALQQGHKLSRLIADLLDISKIESGKLPLEYTTFDIIELTKDVIEFMQNGNKSHKIELSVSSTQLIINADKQRIEQVIINLISNAIKYSYQSSLVKISILNKLDAVLISVQDFGIGIRKEQQEQIFTRFFRVEDHPHAITGLGIGLYISKEIIERHNGKIWVESKIGKGSVFSFEIPV